MLSLKIKLASDIRRVSVADSTTYAELVALVRKLYGAALPAAFNFKYSDEDGDLITVSGESDWIEALGANRLNLTLVVSETAATANNDFADFELLLTSQQQQQQQKQREEAASAPAPSASTATTPDDDFLPLLSVVAAPASHDSGVEEPAVNVDELPLKDRLEALLVEAVFSGEKVIDEVVASLKRATADAQVPTIADLLEGFFQPIRDVCRQGGSKACELLAALQEHAESSLFLARIASMLSLANESFGKQASDVCAAARSAPLNIEHYIRSFVQQIESHPDVQKLVQVIKEKLAASRSTPASSAAADTTTTAAAAAAVVPELVAAAFVADVTVPDDSAVTIGEQYTKTWRVSNSGNVSWPAGVYLGDADGKPVESPADIRPMPGAEIELSTVIRPTTAGLQTVHYGLYTSDGERLLRLWARFDAREPQRPAEWTQALDQLVALGFERDAAEATLVAADGNFHDAMDLLVGSQ